MNPTEASELFSILKAENEPWLAQVFMLPNGCELVKGRQSSLVWGRPGTGKSALRLELTRELQENNLVAHWVPEPPADDWLQGTPLFNFALEQALRASIESLVLHGNLYLRLKNDWTRTSLAWFLRKFLPFEPVFYIQSHGASLGAEQVTWYIELLQQPPQAIMSANATNSDLLRLLMSTLKAAGYQSVTLLVDGLERWSGHNEERAQQMMEAILSTLAVFDSAELVFKFFVPEALRPRFERSAGVLKYRVNQINLSWNVRLLTALLVKRLGLACGREISAVAFCADPAFWGWLSRFGADSPRAWLELAQPFAAHFLKNTCEPLSPECWLDLSHRHPPLLHTADERVWVGEYEISKVNSLAFDLLAYLEKNPGRICSVEEIYYRGMQKVMQIPAKDDPKWNNKDTYRNLVDNALYHLRQKVEINPAHPNYLVTTHSKGIQLFPRGEKNG